MRLNTCLWRPGRRPGNRHLRETSCVGRAWSSWESETAMGHPRAGHVQRSRPQESLAAGGWNPAWRTVFKGKPARARHNLCSERAEWSLDQRVRQKLRMQENRTKTQSPWPRYKIEVWSKKQSKSLISGNKAQDQDILACTESGPDAQQPKRPGLFWFFFFFSYSPELEEVLKPGAELRGNKLLILPMGLAAPTRFLCISVVALIYLTPESIYYISGILLHSS